jgi:photosystem II stability/assembly factor-like uncharacterized protein
MTDCLVRDFHARSRFASAWGRPVRASPDLPNAPIPESTMPARLLLLALLTLVAAAASAQSPPISTATVGIDKSLGEGGKIELRRRWFEETRRLKEFPDAGALRSLGMREQRLLMSRQAPLLLTTAPRWRTVGPAPMNMGSWVMGPVAGRTTALAVRENDDDTLYLGTAAGGLWKSTNGGEQWQRLSDSLDSPSIGAIHVRAGAKASEDEVWVGTGEAYAGGCAGYFGQGLYQSTNGGGAFVARNGSGTNELTLSFINGIDRGPGNSGVILVGGGGRCTGGSSAGSGVYRSTDGGLNWTRTLTGVSMDVRFDPADALIAYAAVNGSGIFKSTDAGVTWINVLATTASHVRLARATADAALLVALTNSTLYRSTDAGTAWTPVNSSACDGQCSYNLAVDAHPTDAARVMVGAIRPYLSSNGGSTLTAMTATWGGGQTVHQDIHIVQFSRNTPERLWIGSDGGLWRSDNGGATFSNLNAGLNTIQFYDVALDVRTPLRMFGGAQDNSSALRDGSDVWSLTFVSGDGFMNSSQPADGADHGRTVFQTSYPSNGPSIYRSTNFGMPATFARLSTAGTSGTFPWVTPMVSTRDMLFVGGQSVYRRANAATAYSLASPALVDAATSQTIRVLSDPDPAGVSPLRLYAGTSTGGVHRTDDALAATPVWTNITPSDSSAVTDIAHERANPDVLFTTHSTFTAPRLRRSLDGGQTWLAIGAGLPPVPANSVAIDPRDTQSIYVGTDIGVYASRDRGESFEPMMLGMPPGTVVTDLEVADTPPMLVAGTYGSSAWLFEFDPDDKLFANGFE